MMMGRPQGGGSGGRPQPGRGGPFMGLSAPVERSKDFRGTLGKLLSRLRSERPVLAVAVVFGSLGVVFSVIGPKITGNAMNIIFDGVLGRTLPAGVPKEQVIESLRARGQGQLADMLAATNAVPGVGVDFAALAQILALAVLVYAFASLLAWAQAYIVAGVAQRTVYGLRREVEEKLARLPLRYFDSHAHGDLLSRVTNDVDNIATTLQQGLSQLLTSVLTVIGVLGMMLWISPLLALISILTIPLSFASTNVIAGLLQIAAQLNQLQSCHASAERFFKFLDAPE